MPRRYRLSLPLWCPQGGVPRRCRFGGRWRHPAGGAVVSVACLPCHCGSQRGGVPSLLPAAPAFSLFSFPLSPRPPSPVGKGEIFLFSYARGSAPCIPGIRTFAAFTEPAKQVPSGGACPPALPARRALAAPCGGRSGFGRLLTLPLWFPAGGRAFLVARLPCL